MNGGVATRTDQEHSQTVLIHSGSGGLGNAAIQICKMVDAEVKEIIPPIHDIRQPI